MPFDPQTAFRLGLDHGAVRSAAAGESRFTDEDRKDALDTARSDPAKFNIGTINPGSTQNVTAELLRVDRHSSDDRSVPHHAGSPDLAVARRHPDRGRVLRRVEIADRRRPDPRDRGNRRNPFAACSRTCRRCGRAASTPRSRAGTRWWRRPRPRRTSSLPQRPRPGIIECTISRSACSISAASPSASTPEELDARLKSDIDKWAAVVKKAGLQPNYATQ